MIASIISSELEDGINSPDTFPDCSIENPWIYRGWYIWKWTGWKGNWAKKNPRHGETLICEQCKKPIENWDIIYISQAIRGFMHVECAQKENLSGADGRIAGQWLAVNIHPRRYDECRANARWLYSSAPGGCGEYKRGGSFDIGEPALTWLSTPEELVHAQEDALRRLYALIDEEINRASV